jgi:hypothetical protein
MTSPTINEFAEYVEDLPRQSPCWGDGILGLYPILAWLNIHPVVVQRELVAEEGVVVGVMMTARAHHNQVGIAVAWATEYMNRPAGPVATDPDDLPELFDLAGRTYLMRNLLAEVRQGVRRFEAKGKKIVMTFDGDRRLDALDRLLDLVDDITDLPEPRAWDPQLRPWLDAGGIDVPWGQSPRWVRAEFQAFAVSLIANYPSYLPAALDVGGFTMGQATKVLEELLARGCYMNACTVRGSTSILVTVPLVDADAFVADLAETTEVPGDQVRQIVALLTLDLARCPDPCLTPLIPLGQDLLLPLSSLIVPGSPVRNFTALLQADPARFGRAGQELGSLGARTTADTLKRLSGALVTTGIKVVRPDRSRAGDLDVVACDPTERTMAIFEIMWRIGPDGSAEVAKAEEDAHAKRVQVARVRGDVESGRATPRWPAHWPDVSEFQMRWFILTPNILPVRTVEPDGTIVRSHQMLARMLAPGSSVAELIDLMDEPHYPPLELTETHWEQVTYGDYEIQFDVARPGLVDPDALVSPGGSEAASRAAASLPAPGPDGASWDFVASEDVRGQLRGR